jgi:hypothetical protein
MTFHVHSWHDNPPPMEYMNWCLLAHKRIVKNLAMHTTSYTLQQHSNFFCLGNLSHLNCSSLKTQWCKNHAKPTPYMNFRKTSKVKIAYIYILSSHFTSCCEVMWLDVVMCLLMGMKNFQLFKKKSQIWLLNPICQLTKMKVTWKRWMKNITSKLRMKSLSNH